MLTALELEIRVIADVDSLVVALWHLHADKATLELMNGLRIPAKVIIGADGINSKARQQLACLHMSALSVCHDHALSLYVSVCQIAVSPNSVNSVAQGLLPGCVPAKRPIHVHEMQCVGKAADGDGVKSKA